MRWSPFPLPPLVVGLCWGAGVAAALDLSRPWRDLAIMALFAVYSAAIKWAGKR